MNATKRTELIDLLQTSEAKILAAIANIDDHLFTSKPTDQWSIAEVIEHIIITDTGLLQSIKKKAERLWETAPETASNELIQKIIPVRKTKVKAPDFLVPKGRFDTKEEAIQAFKYTRGKVEHFVNTTDLPLEQIAFKHFALGLINGEGWIAFMAAHCERHTDQIKELILGA